MNSILTFGLLLASAFLWSTTFALKDGIEKVLSFLCFASTIVALYMNPPIAIAGVIFLVSLTQLPYLLFYFLEQ